MCLLLLCRLISGDFLDRCQIYVLQVFDGSVGFLGRLKLE